MQERKALKWISFTVAILFSLIPLPGWGAWLRPDFLALLIIYWVMTTPDRVGLRTAWLLGILVDIIQGNLFGLHALSYCLLAYVVITLHQRLRLFPMMQQSVCVLFLIALQELIVVWIEGITGHPPQNFGYLLSIGTSMLAWPWLSFVMGELGRKRVYR
jgi:rod shape-determining protein MreD